MVIASRINSPAELKQSGELSPINSESSILFLSQILCNCLPPFSQQQIEKNQQMKALKNLTRLLNLVIEQEKKYQYKLSLYSNFYYRYLIV